MMEQENILRGGSSTGVGCEMKERAMEAFESLYCSQVGFQQELVSKGKYVGFTDRALQTLPEDDPKLFSYHMQQMMSELGEVLAADKRWKSYRNETTFEMLEHKKEELADCFIVLMNMCIFSGLSSEEVLGAVASKINENYMRIMSK